MGCQYIFSKESVGAVNIYSVGVCRGCQYIFSKESVGTVSIYSVEGL